MKISILTPSFNSGAYIERAILSVINQNYDDIEHIIVDGGSTDNTTEVLRKYQHIKWISEKDQGQADAMNKAFNLSSGDIIVYLNADDFFEPDVFNTVVKYFREHINCDILVGGLYHKTLLTGEKSLMKYEHEYKKILLHFEHGFPFNPVAYFYKRNVQEQVGQFPLNEHYAMDYWFLLEAFKHRTVHRINKVFGTFLKTGHNKTSNSNSYKICKLIALRHIEANDNKLLYYYKTNYILSKILQFKYYYKLPFKLLSYYLFFNRKASKQEFYILGFKKAWHKYYK